MNSQWLIILFVGGLVGLFLGAPRVFIANVVFEPRHKTELITWALIVIITLTLFALDKLLILEMQWVPFIIGLFGARAIIILLANRVVDRGLMPEKVLRLFYFLKLWHSQPYEPLVPPEFVKKNLAQMTEPLDTLAYAAICARLSWIAYQDRTAVEQCAQEWGLSCEHVTKDNLAFVVLHDSASIFIAFRGTDDLKDWLVNVDVHPRKAEWGYVHAGFDKAADLLWTEIERVIRETRISDPTIWFAGHSLGGALALISAMKLFNSDITSSISVITFGQPSVGDPSFCDEFDHNLGSQTFRFVNCRDEVPNQPAGYFHTGRLLYFDRKGRFHDQPKKSLMWADGLFRETRSPFEEHAMAQYLMLIESILVYGEGDIERVNQELWEAWGRRVKRQKNIQKV